MSAVTSPIIAGEAVPFLDLGAQHKPLEAELSEAFLRALRSTAFVGGSEVLAFEEEFARFVGSPDSIAVNSGTDALRFAFLALGMKPGDEVITAAHTFIATSEAITQAGGKVRFVDIDEATMTIDPSAIEQAITPRTVGIVPVHLYGQPADMDPILKLGATKGLWIVEDACQAHGARYKSKPVGTLGDLAAFSFYPGKNLGACGEGGAVTGGVADRMATIRKLREHGQSSKYYHDIEGYNGRLDAMQAAFLRIKLRRLADWNEARRRNASLYREALCGVDDLRLPEEGDYAHHVYHLFVVRTEARDALREHLTRRQIGTGLHYPLPLHLQKAYAGLGYREGSLPRTEQTASTILSLPMYAELTETQIERVVDAIREFFGS